MQRKCNWFLGGVGVLTLAAALFVGISAAADPLIREYFTDERGALRKYSRAVVTEGGRTVWLAGQTTLEDADGNAIAGNFDAQLREDFRLIGEYLARFGGSVHDIVTMTAYVTDAGNADRYVAIKEEIFGVGPYPSSAFIGVSGFSRPGVVVEIKAIAVVGGQAE
jgi:enamine deaminase RidA (YjgF/YER057c/UK114 family)